MFEQKLLAFATITLMGLVFILPNSKIAAGPPVVSDEDPPMKMEAKITIGSDEVQKGEPEDPDCESKDITRKDLKNNAHLNTTLNCLRRKKLCRKPTITPQGDPCTYSCYRHLPCDKVTNCTLDTDNPPLCACERYKARTREYNLFVLKLVPFDNENHDCYRMPRG